MRPAAASELQSRADISIHALREEGDLAAQHDAQALVDFYPRPPRGGRPLPWSCPFRIRSYFYPRPPRGGRPGCTGMVRTVLSISIHALREEGDVSLSDTRKEPLDFYPRPPRGGRPNRADSECTTEQFLSTPSARRATRFQQIAGQIDGKFLSTPSARRATDHPQLPENHPQISIHALREEGDGKNRDKISIFKQIIQHSARI